MRGFGAEAKEVARFEAASRKVGPASAKMGEANGRLEALNRAAIYARLIFAPPGALSLFFVDMLIDMFAVSPSPGIGVISISTYGVQML